MNGHPDTESLSAFLDGQAPEVEAHVTTCASCRQQLDALSRVRTAVGAPVRPPDAHQKDSAIAAAIDAASGRGKDTRDRRWRVLAAAGGVAAAVLVGIVATNVSTSHKSAKTASGPVSHTLIRGGDIGDVNDPLELRQSIEPVLQGSEGTSVGADKSASATGSGGAASGGPLIQSGESTVRPRRAVPAQPAKPVAPRCEAEARKLQPNGAVLVYEATARWQGTPADVFGFSPAGAPATTAPGRRTPTRVYVLARSDCHLLVFQSYAP